VDKDCKCHFITRQSPDILCVGVNELHASLTAAACNWPRPIDNESKGDSRGKVNIYGSDRIGHSENKNVCMSYVCDSEWLSSRAVWIWHGQTPLAFCLWGCTKCEVYKRRVDKRGELLARILDAAAGIKKREDQLRRTTPNFRTRVTKGTDVDGGIFECLLWTVTDLSFLRNKFTH